jgi:zinc transport system substrate-binding protein
MKKIILFIILVFLVSCNRQTNKNNDKIITVSIGPLKYFVEAIGGKDFTVNVMVPPGSSPHTYEPMPGQIIALSKSAAYISDGFLGFELTWLDRFYEINPSMKKLSLGEKQNLIYSKTYSEGFSGNEFEGVDPHYWVAPSSARLIAESVKELLTELYPEHATVYESNYQILVAKIEEIDAKANEMFRDIKDRSFIIFHPALSYLARDYNLVQIPVEYEGKEPSPSQMKQIIDVGKSEKTKVIFVQKEFDRKYADEIALEIGAKVEVIDPLSENWPESVLSIITALHDSMVNKK